MYKKVFLGVLCSLVFMGAGCSTAYFNRETTTDDEEYVSDYIMPEELSARVDAPLHATLGESFEVIATIVNGSDEDQLLHSIDVDSAYLDGIAVVSTSPSFADNFLLDDGTITHFFTTNVPAGETVAITFTLEGVTVGDFKGDFDVCFDDGFTCQFLQVRTVIE
ncbi:hypothetical protein HQ487_04120 [Candidatus Uhrbacteria bacterium]|nr:hypothetical protein [Candidatus Uhrbacteria bacterium]